jgi:hypothetical protein
MAGDIKAQLGAAVAMTVTNLQSLASSATAGWQSAVVDNTTDEYLDALVQVKLDFANTAPANSRSVYVFAYGGIESGVYSNPASGSEGAITLLDVTANAQNLRQIGFVPYTTQDEVAESSPMSVAAAFGGILPPYWGVVLINHSGAALAASGNTVKYAPVFAQYT